jgi:ribosomal protein S24E
MSIIETITDVTNSFLSRRELTCNFAGLGGKLKSLEAADMISKEFKLDGKVVIPMRLKTQVGKSLVTGTFYVYDDEGLAKKHINPTIFSRLDKTKQMHQLKKQKQMHQLKKQKQMHQLKKQKKRRKLNNACREKR